MPRPSWRLARRREWLFVFYLSQLSGSEAVYNIRHRAPQDELYIIKRELWEGNAGMGFVGVMPRVSILRFWIQRTVMCMILFHRGKRLRTPTVNSESRTVPTTYNTLQVYGTDRALQLNYRSYWTIHATTSFIHVKWWCCCCTLQVLWDLILGIRSSFMHGCCYLNIRPSVLRGCCLGCAASM